MKRNHLFGMWFISLCAICIASCINNDETEDQVETILLTVAPETTEKMTGYFLSDFRYLGEFMKVQSEKGEWQEMHLSTIDGFNYQDGHQYRLKVKKTTLANPPEDGGNITYELLETVSDEHVNKEIKHTERFYIGHYATLVEGEQLTEKEKKEIENKITASLPHNSKFHHVVYKLIYTDAVNPIGKSIVYLNEEKLEGTFERGVKDKNYTFTINNQRKVFTLMHGSTQMTEKEVFFFEDVTQQYKVDYPALTRAGVKRFIF